MNQPKLNPFLRIVLAFCYIGISFASFPGMNLGWMSWFSFLPLFILLNDKEKTSDFLLQVFICEYLKWILLTVWLRHVSWFAVLGVSAAFSLYHLLWLWLLRVWLGRRLFVGIGNAKGLLLIIAAISWAGFEWFRSQRYGLPGAHLCITQWKTPVILQTASIIGGFGISAWIMFVNLMLTKLTYQIREKGREFWMPLLWLSLSFGITIAYGVRRLNENVYQQSVDSENIRIGIVQPYMPAYLYWNYDRIEKTVRDIWTESRTLISQGTMDFMVWPEGSLPGSIYPNSPMEFEVTDLVDNYLKVPLLFGNQIESDGKFYNGVLLCEPQSGISKDSYRKRILVPFGEFVPFRNYLKSLSTLIPIPEDFDRGDRPVVISIKAGKRNVNISSQICYEDCFPGLLISDDLEDVDLIFVATYNVWYGEEFGAYFHAAHSVMRAVENGRAVLRCGSGGWSGLIDAKGRIRAVVRSPNNGSIYFKGGRIINWSPEPKEKNFYKEHHAWIDIFYGVIALCFCVPMLLKRLKV